MKILIGLGHPAHYHLFKNLILHLKNKNVEFSVVTTEKDVLHSLLESDGVPYSKLLQKNFVTNKFIKLKELFISDYKLYQFVKSFKPTLLVGCLHQMAHIGFLTKIDSIFFAEDDFRETYLQGIITYPYIKQIVTPDVIKVPIFQRKLIQYSGYHELAYLHPNNFLPSEEKIKKLINPESDYFIIRFAQLGAHHDAGKKGITPEVALKLIQILEPNGKVFITSEKELEPAFEKYRINLDPIDIHHALYYAKLFVGDSQTMTTESAVLGTPALRFNDFAGKLSTLEELEHKYGLTYGFPTSAPDLLYAKIEELVSTKNLREEWHSRKKKMLEDKIDLNAFVIWFLENYPESANIIRNSPEFQARFIHKL